jgi:hypothetical protein
MKYKVVRVLAHSEAGTSSDLSPHVRRSFIERRYSPSTGLFRNHWEIILEQLLAMGLIVKEEVVSGNND